MIRASNHDDILIGSGRTFGIVWDGTPPGQVRREGWIGRPLRRAEDRRLVTGAGCFVDDIRPEGCLHVEFARSPVARGALTRLDLAAAQAAGGVAAVFSGPDVAGLGEAAVNPLVPGIRVPPFPVLARGEVHAVGQTVAAVVAASPAQARDAADLIEMEIDACPPRPPGETEVFGQEWRSGDVDAAFASAAHVVRVTVEHARLAPCPLEPRAALASWDEAVGLLTVWLATQTPHRAKADLARILSLDPARIRVVAPDVGGAFGGKASLYPEDALTAFAAMKTGRPVAWRASRSEDFLSASHGRGGTLTGELALAADGRFLGLRADVAFPLGHWMPFSGSVPARNAARILPGPYQVEAVDIAMRGYLTDTAPLGIYRGAGRPEAAMLMERLVDEAARTTGTDPVELRRRNLIGPDALPGPTPTGETLDTGDYPGLLARACTLAGYDALRAERDRRRANGEVCGLGIAVYVEPCGQGWESAALRLDPDGAIIAATGSTAQGQGRTTAVAQIVAEVLNTHPDRIAVRHGDTAETPPGIGALASRSTPIGGSAMLKVAGTFRERARTLAAQLLQTSADGLTLGLGGFTEPQGQRLTWAQLAEAAGPDGREGLATSLVLEASGEAWASGACLAAVAIDRDTGEPTVERLVWVDDIGTVVNPMLVEGQMHGGLAQGLGEALMERIVYDEDGQLVTGSFMDYRLPRADDMPPVMLDSVPTPSRMNPLGAKGVGEAGCIGIPAAVVNAVGDALRPFGVAHLDMPLTSAKLWRAMQQHGRDREETA